jgi:two-component system sensor kinase FixL
MTTAPPNPGSREPDPASPARSGTGHGGAQTTCPAAITADSTLAARANRADADALLLAGLLDGLIDAVVVIDARGRVLRASASVEPLLGWPPRDLERENVRILIPEPHRSAHDEYLARYLATGRTWILGTTREFDVVRRDGTLVPCELCVSRIDFGSQGDAEQLGPMFCGTFRDISDRRRVHVALEHSEARFRAVFEHENQCVLLLDAEGRISDVNLTALERSGRAREAVVGRKLTDLTIFAEGRDGAPKDVVRRVLARANEVGVATARIGVLLRAVDSDDVGAGAFSEVPCELSARVVPSLHSEVPWTIVEIRDVTALVAAERRENTVMRSLARVGEEAAVLAHELRSPVSALELALKAVARNLGADERLLLDDLSARMRRLEDLLRRTLSFSKPLDLDLGPVVATEAFGAALEREAVSLTRARIRSTVHVAPGTPPLLADGRALEDLLANLVRNAAEAQPHGGRLRLAATPVDRHTVRLLVEDGGPGIPLGEREEVFRPFRTTKPDGTGLGLALARKIVEEHDATITLGDADGGGLRILLEWPAAGRPEPEPSPAR